jgi:hypothetical protein
LAAGPPERIEQATSGLQNPGRRRRTVATRLFAVDEPGRSPGAETHTPGAISKIAAVLQNGEEVTIWEGVAESAEAPLETVFPVVGDIVARSVKLYLDTRRVAGWNEIDAVQMIGRDGTSQWASQSAASSSYADQ